MTRDNPDIAGAAFARAYIGRMKRGVLMLGASVVVVVGLVACGGSESANCVSAVQLDGESYIDIDVVSGYRGPTNDSEPQLGELALVTAKEVCGEPLKKNESTTLPPGTELFFVVGEPDLLGHFTAEGVRLYVAGGEYGTAILSP